LKTTGLLSVLGVCKTEAHSGYYNFIYIHKHIYAYAQPCANLKHLQKTTNTNAVPTLSQSLASTKKMLNLTNTSPLNPVLPWSQASTENILKYKHTT